MSVREMSYGQDWDVLQDVVCSLVHRFRSRVSPRFGEGIRRYIEESSGIGAAAAAGRCYVARGDGANASRGEGETGNGFSW
jgi:hypothetical protein